MPTFEQLVPWIVGPVSGLMLSCIGNWWQAKEKIALQATIKQKDADLQSISAQKDKDLQALTREAIGGITTLAGLNQANQRWQDQTSLTLKEIREHQKQ